MSSRELQKMIFIQTISFSQAYKNELKQKEKCWKQRIGIFSLFEIYPITMLFLIGMLSPLFSVLIHALDIF